MRQQPDEVDEADSLCPAIPEPQRQFPRDAALAYTQLLVDGDTSFQAHTIDEVIDAAFAHGGATKDKFRRRYLW